MDIIMKTSYEIFKIHKCRQKTKTAANEVAHYRFHDLGNEV